MLIILFCLLNEVKIADTNLVVIASKTFLPGIPYNFHVHLTPQLLTNHSSNRQYVINNPSKHHYFKEYFILNNPSIHHPSNPLNLSVSISNKQLLVSKIYQNIYDWDFLTIDIPHHVSEDVYDFRVSFPGTVPTQIVIRVDRKVNSIIIQTDKRVYRPGEKVRVRTLVHNDDLNVCEDEVNIRISDPKNNTIYQQKSVKHLEGFITSEIQLSTLTTFGIWKIRAKSRDAFDEIEFKVEEEEVSSFQVYITVPEVYLFHQQQPSKQQSLFLSVKAKCDYGREIKGFAVVTIKYGLKCFSKTLHLEGGKADMSVYPEELYLKKDYKENSSVVVQAIVAEIGNGVPVSVSASVPVCTTRFQLFFLTSTSDFFKPGLSFCGKLRLSKKESSIFPKKSNETIGIDITLTHRRNEIVSKEINVTSEKDEEFCFLIAHNITDILNIQAQFFDEETQKNVIASKTIRQFNNKDKVNIQVSLKNASKSIQSMREVGFVLKSTEGISMFSFLIICRRQLLHSEVVTANNSKEHEFYHFIDKVPFAGSELSVLAYVVSQKGWIVVDELKTNVETSQRNNLSLEVNKEEVLPGGMLELTVKGVNGSIAALYAVTSDVNNNVGLFMKPSFFLKRNQESIIGRLQNQNDDLAAIFWTETIVKNTSTIIQFHLPPKPITTSVTLWIQALSINQNKELHICEKPIKIKVTSPFYFFVNLPSTCVLGEEIPVEMNIYNHLKEAIMLRVTMLSSKLFKTKVCEARMGCLLAEVILTRVLSAKPKDLCTTIFRILPTFHGHIPIYIKAFSFLGALVVEKSLFVKHQGIKHSYSLLSTFDSTSPTLSNTSLFPTFPSSDLIVPGSDMVEAFVYDNVLGPSIENIENFHKNSGPLAEQKLLSMFTYAYILKYLHSCNSYNNNIGKALGEEFENVEKKALVLINLAYQSQLTFMKKDASINDYANTANIPGSVFLTSQWLNALSISKAYLQIDQDNVDLIINWLVGRQMKIGSFVENNVNKTVWSIRQRGPSGAVMLTASVLISLINARNFFSRENVTLDQSVQKALEFLEDYYTFHMQDPCVLAIVSYAFLLAKSDQLNKSLHFLERLTTNENEMSYWRCQDLQQKAQALLETSSSTNIHHATHHQASTAEIESNSYALLTYLSLANSSKATSILNWLLRQSSTQGEFGATKESIISTEAISKYASFDRPKLLNMKMTINLMAENRLIHQFKVINLDNTLFYQGFKLPSSSTKLTFSKRGMGFVIFQCNVAYYTQECEEDNDLSQQLTTTSDGTRVNLEIQISFKGDEEGGMMVVEVEVLSGYIVANLHDVLIVDSTIIHHHFNLDHIVFYFSPIKERKLKLILEQKFTVCKLRPSWVKSYSRAKPEKKVSGFYTVQNAKAECQDN